MIKILNPTRLDKLALNIFNGIKNTKTQPTNRGFQFQKDKPMTMHNYPLTQRTRYKIRGYKQRGVLKEPHWIEAEIATGRNLTPQSVGLDGFYEVIPLQQTGVISPRKEKSRGKELADIPDFPTERNDRFIYSKEIINNRGYIQQNVARK